MGGVAMADLAAYTIWVPTLLMVLFRLTGLFLTAPLLSHVAIPPTVKGLLAVIMSLGVTARMTTPVPLPPEWTALVLGLGGEILLGATIGYAAGLIFMGIELGAEQIAQQMGIALASVFNPMFEDSSNVLAGLMSMAAMTIFLVIGGHRLLISGMVDTFGTVPLMGYGMHAGVLDAMVELLRVSFMLSIKLAAPALVALFLASISMGFVQRTMPQLNILSAGFQIRVLLGLAIVTASVTTLLPLMERGWSLTMDQLMKIFL
jgi:flagellar biosynthetic protein FliR